MWLDRANEKMNVELQREARDLMQNIPINSIEMGVFVGVEKIKPKKIIQNGIATIVFWNDGTKTVIKLADGDENDLFTAFCVAFTKRLFGSTSAINRQIEKTYQPSKEESDVFTEFLKMLDKKFNRGKND